MRYEIVLNGETAAPQHVPTAGETFQFGGETWEVERVDAGTEECPRVHLAPCATETADVEAHRRVPVTGLGPPTSFEGELIYTLTDLSTRLSTLAQVLTSYWGKGAA